MVLLLESSFCTIVPSETSAQMPTDLLFVCSQDAHVLLIYQGYNANIVSKIISSIKRMTDQKYTVIVQRSMKKLYKIH